MLKVLLFLLCLWGVNGYFTLPGKCPQAVPVMDTFNLAEFYGKWYQTYHYSSDGQNKNRCSSLEFSTKRGSSELPVVLFNQTRVDRGLFHRYSIAKVTTPKPGVPEASLELVFEYDNAPRRLKTRKYQFQVLATNYNYYATAYTCQYSPLINKHFIYVWILSRKPILNDVSKELAIKSLQHLGLESHQLLKNDLSNCVPKYFDDIKKEPLTFRFPVPI